ncbi:RagB/SusD family nutrient uptake outer membrane protein [Paraflavitalea devenefica]|uniref:RagB/SusD family nutrient uptake outer membrane protein n=1 Tax=Paraflavitalea devenefica TaxID=2716334 RepID=UPI001FE2CA7C|nr:RagB/SusD family nutrient uptake outer membrane protein [Paraflavitalea devenefica]
MAKKLIQYTALSLLLAAGSGCTKLDENIYDQMLTDNFYNNKNEVLSAVLRPYTHANAWTTPSGQPSWYRFSEMPADQIAWPTKGRHGEDGGKWKRLHYHTWPNDESDLNRAWQLMWWGLGLCTDPIENLEKRDIASMGITQEEKDAFIAELKLLRAYHYLRITDLWGAVPIVTKIGEPAQPPTASREEVFNFIEKEILDNINKAPKHSADMIGRMSQAGAYAMLVELYLNADAWIGKPKWDECIAAANKLINGEAGGQNGAMALDPNIFDAFKPENDKSKEAIFSIAYNFSGASFQPSWTGEFYHFNQKDIYGGSRNGNDGMVLIPGVWTNYDDKDLRKRGWLLEGPQFYFTDPTKPVVGGTGNEYDKKPLVFVDNIRRNSEAAQNGTDPNLLPSNMSTGEENSGVRFNKYKLGNQVAGPAGIPVANPNYNNTDWHIYRLTMIVFAKAEAIMRKNNGVATQEAVDLINSSRKRAFTDADWPTFAYTTTTLTMDELLAERGREFIFEGYRRQDLIRWNKFTTATWWDHQPTEAFRKLYPIPQQQRALNPNLDQNDGYTK